MGKEKKASTPNLAQHSHQGIPAISCFSGAGDPLKLGPGCFLQEKKDKKEKKEKKERKEKDHRRERDESADESENERSAPPRTPARSKVRPEGQQPCKISGSPKAIVLHVWYPGRPSRLPRSFC